MIQQKARQLMIEKKSLKTDVLIIGGGVTGTGLARDLAFRGISSIVLEMDMINSGASGRNHGLLHSGARYVSSDLVSAMECKKEADILKRIAPHCIEETGGLYVATRNDKEDYISLFPQLCKKVGIPCQKLTVKQALELEPSLSHQIVAAFRVEDASVDPFHISLENMNQAIEYGARYFSRCKVTKFITASRVIQKVMARDLLNKRLFEIESNIVVNAAGAWAGEIAKLAGIHMGMLYSKGTLLITHNRITHHVINRLRIPSDGDILVPGGTVSIFGTTAMRIDSLEKIRPSIEETDILVKEAKAIVPALENTKECRTTKKPLLSKAPSQMTEAGMSFRIWAKKGKKDDITMCECAMISKNQFKQLISWLKENKNKADLNALRIYSRLGKGACQGTFCCQRVTGFMYDANYLKEDEGIYNIKDLLHERFVGQRSVLWGDQLSQAELCEALYGGFYGLKLEKQ